MSRIFILNEKIIVVGNLIINVVEIQSSQNIMRVHGMGGANGADELLMEVR